VTDTLLEVASVSKRFLVAIPGEGRRSGHQLHAVDDVSFTIGRGECVGLVGESGCGKSTLIKLITRLLDVTDGRIWFDGHDIGTVPAARFAHAAQRARIQMVFQDPTDSLNPRFTAFDSIADPLRRLGALAARAAILSRVLELADLVGFPQELLHRYPHQLSGGQKQRVGIARAVALEPSLLVLDEPTSALDVSVQAVILKLLEHLRRRLGMSYLFVSHDLNVVRLLADRVLVMYLGRIVEAGPAGEVFTSPRHPYTRALLSSMPSGSGAVRRIRLSGEPLSPIDPDPNMCRFYGRCPEGTARCAQEMPVLRPVLQSAGVTEAGGHFPRRDEASVPRDHLAACHLL
jgi:peptide/nickel transport system ATP-binding protein